MGSQMNFIKEKIKISANGFRKIKLLSQTKNCNGCPVRDTFNKSKAALSHNLRKMAARN